jgi:hypothetical protein
MFVEGVERGWVSTRDRLKAELRTGKYRKLLLEAVIELDENCLF